MQADTGLIQHVEHAGQMRADLGGQPDPLAFAAGKGSGCPGKGQIAQAYAVQKALYGASLNLSRMMLERRGKTVERLLIVHLKKDGTYKLVPLEISDTVAMALITLHTATTRRRRNNGRRTEDQ